MSIHEDIEPTDWTPVQGDIFIASAILIIVVLMALGFWAVKVMVAS